jgi:hypothetical protein
MTSTPHTSTFVHCLDLIVSAGSLVVIIVMVVQGVRGLPNWLQEWRDVLAYARRLSNRRRALKILVALDTSLPQGGCPLENEQQIHDTLHGLVRRLLEASEREDDERRAAREAKRPPSLRARLTKLLRRVQRD